MGRQGAEEAGVGGMLAVPLGACHGREGKREAGQLGEQGLQREGEFRGSEGTGNV